MLEKTDKQTGPKDKGSSELPDVSRRMDQYKLPKRSATDLPATNTEKPEGAELPRRLTDQEMQDRIEASKTGPMGKVIEATRELNKLVIAEEKKRRNQRVKDRIQSALKREKSDPLTKAMEEPEDVVDPRLSRRQE